MLVKIRPTRWQNWINPWWWHRDYKVEKYCNQRFKGFVEGELTDIVKSALRDFYKDLYDVK